MDKNTQTILEWQAPSRPDYVRSHRWYVGGGIFCGFMIVYGLLTEAWSLSLVFAFLPALYYLLRNEGHKIHTLRILGTGIEFDGKLIVWADFKEFWILSGPDFSELHIARTQKSRADLVIQTGALDPYLVRDTLAEFLPQAANKKEKLLDAFIRFCKL
jgi:hypothetical protein